MSSNRRNFLNYQDLEWLLWLCKRCLSGPVPAKKVNPAHSLGSCFLYTPENETG